MHWEYLVLSLLCQLLGSNCSVNMVFDLDAAKDAVWAKLNKLTGNELTNLCTALKLTVEPSKENKKWALISVITQHLSSEEVDDMDDDQQETVFVQLEATVDGMLHLRKVKDETNVDPAAASGGDAAGGSGGTQNVGPPSSTSSNPPSSVTSNSATTASSMVQGLATLASGTHLVSSFGSQSKVPDYVRLKRDFRIDGTVGLGSPNSLSFTSLCYYIQRGEQDGYKPEEIMAGCIRATKAGSLRFYLESQAQMSMDEFIKALKLHYNGKQAMKLLNEMAKRYQGDEFAMEQNENEVQFCMRMNGYCQDISKLSAEEGDSIDQSLIQKTFYESLSTGFKQGAVRLELQKTLRDANLSVSDLLDEINLVMNKEEDHRNKRGENQKKVGVKEVDLFSGSGSRTQTKSRDIGDTDDGMLCSAITALTTQVSELTSITKERGDEMKTMKKQVEKCLARLAELSGEKEEPKKIRFKKCDECEKNKKFCRHCYICGSGQHKFADCPENP